MKHFLSVLGKFVLFLVSLGLVAGGAYYLGTQNPSSQTAKKEFIVASSDTLVSPTGSVAPTTSVPSKLVEAGTKQHTKYTISVPVTWEAKNDIAQDDMDKLVITKDGYILTIYQAAMGGSMYSFPDTPQAEGPMVQPYKGSYVDFKGSAGQNYRRIDASSQNKPGEKAFSILSKGTDAYMTPTSFGAISYTTPINPVKSTLDEMDAMVATLEKQ